MSNLSKALILAALCCFGGMFGAVNAGMNDDSKYRLEASRNALLDRRERLLRLYTQLQRQSDDLIRQLSDLQLRTKDIYTEVARTENRLRDVEYALR